MKLSIASQTFDSDNVSAVGSFGWYEAAHHGHAI
jgi:hypothetical protein